MPCLEQKGKCADGNIPRFNHYVFYPTWSSRYLSWFSKKYLDIKLLTRQRLKSKPVLFGEDCKNRCDGFLCFSQWNTGMENHRGARGMNQRLKPLLICVDQSCIHLKKKKKTQPSSELEFLSISFTWSCKMKEANNSLYHFALHCSASQHLNWACLIFPCGLIKAENSVVKLLTCGLWMWSFSGRRKDGCRSRVVELMHQSW